MGAYTLMMNVTSVFKLHDGESRPMYRRCHSDVVRIYVPPSGDHRVHYCIRLFYAVYVIASYVNISTHVWCLCVSLCI